MAATSTTLGRTRSAAPPRAGEADRDLERDPLAEVPETLRGHLVREVNALGPEDEARVAALLESFRAKVVERRVDTYPLFKDYDRKFGFTKGVTPSQFRRLLDGIGLPFDEVLLRKFGDEALSLEESFDGFDLRQTLPNESLIILIQRLQQLGCFTIRASTMQQLIRLTRLPRLFAVGTSTCWFIRLACFLECR